MTFHFRILENHLDFISIGEKLGSRNSACISLQKKTGGYLYAFIDVYSDLFKGRNLKEKIPFWGDILPILRGFEHG